MVKLKGNRTKKFEKFSICSCCKKKKGVCFEENMKGVARLSLDQLITHVINGVNQPSQQKPGVEMELY